MSSKLRRSLLATGVPLAAGLSFTGTALAAGAAAPVTVRVEGATRTLLQAKSVTAPTTGSITKGKTPAGTCPADSAAGALAVATHGRWNGTYYKGLGIDVTTILGTTPKYDNGKGSYWEFFLNNRAASKGVCDTSLKRGDSLLFAQVPAKGKPERPIVLTAPKTVTAGRSFNVKAFVYTGKGSATKPVVGAHAALSSGGSHLKLTSSRSTRKGELRLTLTGASSGTATLVVSAKGEILSAATTIKVTK